MVKKILITAIFFAVGCSKITIHDKKQLSFETVSAAKNFGQLVEKKYYSYPNKILSALADSQKLNPILVILSSDQPFCFTSGNVINLSSGLIKLLDSEDELAFLFGHELWHIKKGFVNQANNIEENEELLADSFGKKIIENFGYNEIGRAHV